MSLAVGRIDVAPSTIGLRCKHVATVIRRLQRSNDRSVTRIRWDRLLRGGGAGVRCGHDTVGRAIAELFCLSVVAHVVVQGTWRSQHELSCTSVLSHESACTIDGASSATTHDLACPQPQPRARLHSTQQSSSSMSANPHRSICSGSSGTTSREGSGPQDTP